MSNELSKNRFLKNGLPVFLVLTSILILPGCLPIEQEVAAAKRGLPKQIAPGITWTDIQAKESEVVFYYDLASNMNVDTSQQDEMKEKMLDGLKRNKKYFRRIVAYNVTLTYVIRKNSSEQMRITFEPSELSENGVGAGGGSGITSYGLVFAFFFLGLVGVCVPRPRGRSYKADLIEKKKKRRKRA